MSVGRIILNIVDSILSPLMADFLKELKKNNNAQRVIALYGNSKFVKIRFWDAPFIQVEKLITDHGKIVDLGCGEGIFTNYLAASSSKRQIIGVELDRERYETAGRQFKNVTFKQGDVTKVDIPQADNVVMFHLLHHLRSYEPQELLIKKVLTRLNKNGKLLIVEVDIKLSLKFLISWLTDCFLVPWIFEHRFFTPVYFRRSQSWKKLIESYGYRCKVIPAAYGKPFSHVVLECRK